MVNFISIEAAMLQGTGPVALRGWVHRERGSAQFTFVVIRDHSQIIQCVISKAEIGEAKFAESSLLRMESSVEIFGEIHEDKRAPTGYEVHVTGFHIVGPSDSFPITKDQSPEYLLDNRHLWLRSRKLNAIMRIRSTLVGAIHTFFRARGFYEFHAPILQPNQCEGGSTLFEVKYYKDKTYLTQSWQLYAEAAIFSLENIYNVSPTFRAEKSKTSRHLSEFWMAEMESAWMGLDEITVIAKEEVAFLVQEVLKKHRKDLELLGQDPQKLEKMTLPFLSITYTEALRVLKEKEGMDIPFGKDLRTLEEEQLMKHFDKPLVVTHYPKAAMAFYKQQDPTNPDVALCFDMLAPEGYGEIIGGSQRDTSIAALTEALKAQGENPENYAWYLDLRKYGSVPHAGYGLGVERILAWICKLDNIKDAIPFPRTLLRKQP